MGLLIDPVQQWFLEGGKLEKKVLRLSEIGLAVGNHASGLDQILRIKRPAAIVALVAPCPLEAAIGARAVNVPVGKKPLAVGTIGQEHRLLIQITPF